MRKWAHLRVALALLLCVSAAPHTAAQDVEGGEDHPLIGRYEGSVLVGHQVADYDEAVILEGPFDPVRAAEQTGPGFRSLEGRTFLIYYKLPDGRSTLEVLRNYEVGLKANGFEVSFRCATSDGSCFESGRAEAGYLLGAAVGDAQRTPRFSGDYVHNWFQGRGRYLLATLDRPNGAVYAGLYLGEGNRGSVAVVRVVEMGDMDDDKIVTIDATAMERSLSETGRVDLYGIEFDHDKDTLRPESRPTLEEVARLLSGSPDLKLRIIGHTDNRGSETYNLDLSHRRAASVVRALTDDHGIEAGRLASEGAGFLRPVTPNDSEEGRARNRRVEIVVE